ncbi:metallophosphoesterase [Duganella sp. FT27W]|uniref:metallophosphoesterase n=1 Tax=Duganella sp. FT27W TaxID=2654636 RepID=UPI00128B8907|nr:metallophosphoesterase [Duganella sp. FT27W]MPQ56351.1 serine/threonine protein phosphatase [Duganella sp. FT27W]
MKPFGVISDTHHHGWSAFATTTPDGINSRLAETLSETRRCADAVLKAGGNTIYHGGDLFHVRGSIAPSVLNPTMDCYKELIAKGIRFVINAGNHDLEGKEAARVSSAITSLEGIGCHVVNAPNYHAFDDMVIIPWIPKLADLKVAIEHVAPADRPGCDLLLHAPIDGVIPGLPDHGLDWGYLNSLGYRRVFAGHYHHHKNVGGNVWSIGSLTAQTWSDIGAKAGFLLVDDTDVKWMASHAPSFVEIDGGTDASEIPLIVDGNYVRVKMDTSKESDVTMMRDYLTSVGAHGVTILPVKKIASATARAGGTLLKAGATLEQSIGDFIKTKGFRLEAAVAAECADVLAAVRSVA